MVIKNSYRPPCCPACKSSRLNPLGALKYADPTSFAGAPLSLSSTPHLEECLDCGTWFTTNSIAPLDAIRLYANGRGDTHWRADAFELCKTPEVVQALNAVLRPGIDVVDVGCNTGELLDFCRTKGATTTGIELAEAARHVCIEKGHNLVPDLAAVSGSVDVIFAFDLVEHLYNLEDFLRSAHAALRPGGKLVILTGDNKSLTARTARQRWWYARYPEHIIFPSWYFWQNCAGFTDPVRLHTYASRGYRASPARRLRGVLNMMAGVGNGLPLVGPDHHLLTLTRNSSSHYDR